MRITITLLAFAMMLQTGISQEPEVKQFLEIDMRLKESGKALRNSATLSGYSIAMGIVGGGVTTAGILLGNPGLALGGSVITLISVPLNIASIAQIGKAGRSLERGSVYSQHDRNSTKMSPEELEELRRTNE